MTQSSIIDFLFVASFKPLSVVLSSRNNTPPLGQQSVAKVADPWDLDFLASATVTKPAQVLTILSFQRFFRLFMVAQNSVAHA